MSFSPGREGGRHADRHRPRLPRHAAQRRPPHHHSGQDHHVVLLQEPESGRRLPIWIGQEHALELALRLLGHSSQLPRPLGSDLSAHLVQALGGNVREVRIDRLTEGTYCAVIVVQGAQGITEVDARPSDALALALVVGAPIQADRAVVDTTEADETVAETLATIDSQNATGAQALLDELAEEAQRQDLPEAPGS
jgi:bifunctional DNase/RNase